MFNSVEFWGGRNPVEPPSGHSRLPKTTHIVRGDAEAWLTYRQTAEGRVLLTAQSLADGRVVIQDGTGRAVASYRASEGPKLASARR